MTAPVRSSSQPTGSQPGGRPSPRQRGEGDARRYDVFAVIWVVAAAVSVGVVVNVLAVVARLIEFVE